jgi:hypothetical protein
MFTGMTGLRRGKALELAEMSKIAPEIGVRKGKRTNPT